MIFLINNKEMETVKIIINLALDNLLEISMTEKLK